MGGDAVDPVDSEQQQRLEERFGAGARDWIEALPKRAAELAQRWRLEFTGVHCNGRTSVVYACRRASGQAAMLKLCPDPGLVAAEARTLRLWQQSTRVPQVLEVDVGSGAMLMEAIEPGETLGRLGEVPQMELVTSLMAELHSVPLSPRQRAQLKPLSGWVHYYFDQWEQRRAAGPAAEVVSASLMHRGYCRVRELAGAEDHVVPLHGDLHCNNVLDGGPERGLVAIDPRGCAGDPAFDAVDWALWQAETSAEVERRIAVLAPGVGTEPERLAAVCAAVAPVIAVARVTNGTATPAQLDLLLDFAESGL